MSRKRSKPDARQRRAQEPLHPHLISPTNDAPKKLSIHRQRRAIVRLIAAKLQSPYDRELTTKRRGELAELAFMLWATTLGFAVCKPYGDSERYDFITDSHEPDRMPKLSRVQVKCSTQIVDGLYRLNAHRRVDGRAVPYKLTEIDFIAAYILPEDTWYIIPLADILGQTSLFFRGKKDRRPDPYAPYREAWHLLRTPDGLTIA